MWLNNDIEKKKLPEEILNDDRVKIFETDSDSKNVGYHKYHAFHKGEGDVLVEVDSDDIITPCLLYTSPSPRDATLSRMPSSA